MILMGLVLTTIFSSSSASAYFEGNRRYDGLQVMNGIEFEKYKSFPEKWKFVTVRYREDNGEIRLTYANPLAYAHLQKMKGAKTYTPFPEGSVFGKIAYSTEKDPNFTSSKIPSNSRRYQLMIRDSKKFKSTDGWGYAIFDERGVTYNEEPAAKTAACHACHTIVKNMDYVFSIEMPLAVGSMMKTSGSPLKLDWHKFEASELASKVTVQPISAVAKVTEAVDQLDPKLLKSFFSGTLDEILPTLLARSRETGRPAIYIGDKENYSLVLKSSGEASCRQMLIVFGGRVVRDNVSCAKP